MNCEHGKQPMKFCPYCGEPLEAHGAEAERPEVEGPEEGITILVVSGEDGDTRPSKPAADIPKRLGLMPKPRDPGSFHDRVAKRIRRTVSGKE